MRLIVAIAGLLQLHAPPAVALLKVVDAPEHTFVLPVIATGDGFTVIMEVV